MHPRPDITWSDFWWKYCYRPYIRSAMKSFVIFFVIVARIILMIFWLLDKEKTSTLIQTLTNDLGQQGAVCAAYLLVLIVGTLALESKRNQERILDLPWRKPWVWAFVALTIVPGFLVYPFSIIGVIRDRRKRSTSILADESAEQSCGTTPGIRARYHFNNDPDSARAAFLTARTGDYRRGLEDQRIAAQSDVARLSRLARELVEQLKTCSSAESQSLSDSLTEYQLAKGKALADVAETERQLSMPFEKAPAAIEADAEFDQIMQLPGVIGAYGRFGYIHFLVRATLKYRGDTYFMGDWEISIGASAGLRTACKQAGVTRDWRRSMHPDYRDPHDDLSEFCLGSRRAEVMELATKRHYLEAIELVVNSMNSVNPQDEYLVPQAFQKVGELWS